MKRDSRWYNTNEEREPRPWRFRDDNQDRVQTEGYRYQVREQECSYQAKEPPKVKG